jgi:hypothetical protein
VPKNKCEKILSSEPSVAQESGREQEFLFSLTCSVKLFIIVEVVSFVARCLSNNLHGAKKYMREHFII